jgi:hypothetical protein
MQPLELSSFQHPYQNGRGSVVSEKVGRKRRKQAQSGRSGRGRGSDNSPGMAALCGLSAPMNAAKKNVPSGCLGGGKRSGREHSFRRGALKHYESALRTVLCNGLRCSTANTAAQAHVAEDDTARGPLAAQPQTAAPHPDRRFDVMTRGRSPVRQCRSPGSVQGVASNCRLYRDFAESMTYRPHESRGTFDWRIMTPAVAVPRRFQQRLLNFHLGFAHSGAEVAPRENR